MIAKISNCGGRVIIELALCNEIIVLSQIEIIDLLKANAKSYHYCGL